MQLVQHVWIGNLQQFSVPGPRVQVSVIAS